MLQATPYQYQTPKKYKVTEQRSESHSRQKSCMMQLYYYSKRLIKIPPLPIDSTKVEVLAHMNITYESVPFQVSKDGDAHEYVFGS